jgi:hypothetical protein
VQLVIEFVKMNVARSFFFVDTRFACCMAAAAYDRWDRSAAASRALQHADSSSSRDSGGGIWNFAFGSNMSASKVCNAEMHALVAPPRHNSQQQPGAKSRHQTHTLSSSAIVRLEPALQPHRRFR